MLIPFGHLIRFFHTVLTMKLATNQALLVDQRSLCLSVTLVTSVADYLQFIEGTYKARGGLEGQRLPLKTKTAMKIRGRMVGDLIRGAVLPPLVIGVVPKDKTHFQKLEALASAGKLQEFMDSIEQEEPSQIAVIDGMQRTTALLDALKENEAAVADREVRIEFWVGASTNSLIYRMLVLNTGQVPWDLKRQLETVYSILLREIKERVQQIQVFQIDDNSRRATGAQYQSSLIIESYFAFTSRKPKVDVKERVAEDFARIDATDSASNDVNLERFMEALKLLSELDTELARYVVAAQAADGEQSEVRFQHGKDIFGVRAAVVGFVSAFSVAVYGDPGFEFDDKEVLDRFNLAKQNISNLIGKLKSMSPDAVGEFLQLELLNLMLEGRTGGVGDFERDFFHRAFSVAIKYGADLHNMIPCWRA